MDSRSRENFLVHVMNTGFERAATSFSKLINKSVKISNSNSIFVLHDEDFSYISEEAGELYVLVTQIIGEISGKSFLIFNHYESQEIFKVISPLVRDASLNESFLLEIDNIISASVIAELSNALNLEIYGDVPQIIKVDSQHLQALIGAEVNKANPSSLIFSNTTFQFENSERVHPQFIWKMSSKVFDFIPAERITV